MCLFTEAIIFVQSDTLIHLIIDSFALSLHFKIAVLISLLTHENIDFLLKYFSDLSSKVQELGQIKKPNHLVLTV